MVGEIWSVSLVAIGLGNRLSSELVVTNFKQIVGWFPKIFVSGLDY